MTHLPQNLVDAPYGPHQDFIINGSFDVNQRGAVLSTSTLYQVADRHIADCSNVADTGFSQELRDFAIGFSDVPNSPEKYMRINFNGTAANAASHWVTYGYRIDRPLRFVNGVWTYDLWVRPQANMAVGMETRMGAGSGNPADNIAMINPQIFPLTGGVWQRLPIKITTPIWTPASVGVGARLNLVLALSLGTDFSGGGNYVGAQDGYLDIAETSFTPGDNRKLPVIKAPRDVDAELLRCLPYFQTSYDTAAVGSAGSPNGKVLWYVENGAVSGNYAPIEFKGLMRMQPAITLYEPYTGTQGYLRNKNDETSLVADAVGISQRGALVRPGSSAGIDTGDQLEVHWAASAEI